MNNPTVQFEWLFETLNKRVSQGIKLSELFLCVPYPDEAEFDYELSTAFNNFGVSQGLNLAQDYPNLARVLGHNKKESLLRIFFIKPERLARPVLCWTKKFKYPKISCPKSPKLLLALKALDNIEMTNKILNS